MTTMIGSRRSLCLPSLALLLLTACTAVDRPPDAAGVETKQVVSDLHRDQGFAALDDERYPEAASSFERILKEAPDDRAARLGLGEAYLGLGRLDEALGQFAGLDDAVGAGAGAGADAADRARALQGRGITLLRLGRHDQASRFLDQAVERDAGLWRSWNALGRLRDARKDHTAAREAYRTAISLNPKAALLHNNLGFSFLASGEPAYAEASLNRALDLDPGLDIASTNLRLALALQGRYGPALAGTSTEERAVVMNNVGYAALLRGDHRRARALFQNAMAADPGFFGEARRNLAYLETLETGGAR